MSGVPTENPAISPQFSRNKDIAPIEMSVEVLIFLLFKAFSAMRTYSPDHPLFQNALLHLFQTFDEFFEAYDQLKIEVSESGILFQGQEVYQENEKRGSVTFMLFNDGIREIRFQKGLTRDEIKEFMGALKTSMELPPEERDMVSLLWSKDFSHIQYFAFDEIPDQAVDYVERGIARMEGATSEISSRDAAALAAEIQASKRNGESGDPGFASTKPPAVLSPLVVQSQDAIEGLLGSLIEDTHFDSESELIDIIFDLLYLEEDPNRSQPILRFLEHHSDDLLSRGAFAQVNSILQNLQSFLEGGTADSRCLNESVDAMLNRFAEEKVHALRKTLNEGIIAQPDELRLFISSLRPIAIDPVCHLMEEVSNQRIRSLLGQGLEMLVQDQIWRLGHVLERASEAVAKDIVTILGRIGNEQATLLLRKCAGHPSAAVREEALRALCSIPSREATDAMVPFLTDEDAAVRTAAAEGIDSSKGPFPIDRILPIVREKWFFKRSFREKKALLSVLGKDGSDHSIQHLEAILSKRSLFFRKQHDATRTCAAFALGLVETDAAYALLERYSHDAPPTVKRACIQALRNRKNRV